MGNLGTRYRVGVNLGVGSRVRRRAAHARRRDGSRGQMCFVWCDSRGSCQRTKRLRELVGWTAWDLCWRRSSGTSPRKVRACQAQSLSYLTGSSGYSSPSTGSGFVGCGSTRATTPGTWVSSTRSLGRWMLRPRTWSAPCSTLPSVPRGAQQRPPAATDVDFEDLQRLGFDRLPLDLAAVRRGEQPAALRSHRTPMFLRT